jgi:LmbE family N-acetylglucosaminyl deacetylase
MSGAVSETVVLAPHPDDAVLSAWSVLRAGARACTVCSGVPPAGSIGGFDRVFGVEDSAKLVALRLDEDAAALRRAGCDAPVTLGFLDSQYRSAPLSENDLHTAVADATAGATHVVAPAGIGAHPDHVAVRNTALRIARERDIALTLYADLPYAVRFGWPAWVTGHAVRPYLVPDALWADELPVGVELARHAVALTANDAAQKLAALRCYETQFEALNAGPLDRLRNEEILGFEVRFTVTFP